uniref:Uncharacterized protein n=1 Tax=Tanacetum cinerariifolium TaxID=118510 RepID=A0A6L2NN95_TANCI|nr:hypothetical protein [Tanacetum cinerariifolium]
MKTNTLFMCGDSSIYTPKESSRLMGLEECHLVLTNQIDLVNLEGNRVVPDISKPLPLGGPPGQATIQTQCFFNKDLEYLVSEDKEKRNTLSRSKLKVAYYPDSRLEELVSLVWTESERVYDISVAYDITWKIYNSELRVIKLSWDATDFLFKENYTIVHKPRAIIYRDRNNQKKMTRESKMHKFSDGTLTRILEKLDHMVKDYVLFKLNHGIEHRIWSEDDKRRSKEFIEVIERRLKIKRIFRSLKSFVSGRLRDVDNKLIQRTE